MGFPLGVINVLELGTGDLYRGNFMVHERSLNQKIIEKVKISKSRLCREKQQQEGHLTPLS